MMFNSACLKPLTLVLYASTMEKCFVSNVQQPKHSSYKGRDSKITRFNLIFKNLLFIYLLLLLLFLGGGGGGSVVNPFVPVLSVLRYFEMN